MANKNDEANKNDGTNERLVTSKEDVAKANKWFVRARELGEKRQFDYAIEYYVNGLEFWPEAVEEACKPLHGCAVARRQTGGKKPGFADTMRRSLSDKNAKKAFMNALWLFGREPGNINFVEGVVKNAGRLRAEDTVFWSAGICLKELESNAKSSAKQFRSLTKSLEELGDRAIERSETSFAVESLQLALEVLNFWRRRFPKDDNLEIMLRNLSTKLTITKGKYKDGQSFQESIADKEEQKDSHDRHRSVQTEDRLGELIAKAEEEFNADKDSVPALNQLVELLCKPEREDYEKKAMAVLIEVYKQTDDYRRKMAADDIRMRQLARRERKARKAGDEQATKEAHIASLKYDLAVYKERVEKYPTDYRLKYEYATRLFRAGRIDDAIPLFQAARSDPKNRISCGMHLGRCFFLKKYYTQAITTLEAEIEGYEIEDDDMAKKMLYWLGRSQEGNGEAQAARETYGKILQMDYNYLDVRDKLDKLPPTE